jgi:hypothetical protein
MDNGYTGTIQCMAWSPAQLRLQGRKICYWKLSSRVSLETRAYWTRINIWPRLTWRRWNHPWGNSNIIGYWLYRPRGMLNYYGSKGSPNQQLVVTPHESRAGKYQLSASQQGQRCFLYSICDLFLQIFLSYCLGLPRAHKMREEESSPLFCGFTAALFGSTPLAYEDSGKVKLV